MTRADFITVHSHTLYQFPFGGEVEAKNGRISILFELITIRRLHRGS